MKTLDGILVRKNCSIRHAFEQLQSSGKGVLLLVDEDGRLLRTVSDGDLRRLMLEGEAMEDLLAALPEISSVIAKHPISSTMALEILNARKLDQLPVVDLEGRPMELLHRRDLDGNILLSTPHLGEEELTFIQEALTTNWVAPLGPNVDAFEREMAEYLGVSHATAVSSGTAAIHLALRILGIGPGDTVFCSSLTFVASANPIIYQGAEPVFIDSAPGGWNMSLHALEAALASAASAGALPKAVIVVNLYGQSADMDPILKTCASYGVPVVEDAAESLGATYKGRRSGTFGMLGAFSFNGNKIITTSGGGMLVSDDEELVKRARFLATQAKEQGGYYQHEVVGYNYRMSNVLAGIGRGQLRVLDDRVRARRAVCQRYQEALADVTDISWPTEPVQSVSTHWLSVCLLDGGPTPDEMIGALCSDRIEARRVWKPMHLQPLFKGRSYWPHSEGQDVSADLFARGLCLPSGSNLTEVQQARIIESIRRALGKL